MVLLQKSNYHQLEEIVKLCKVGFHELEVQVQLTGWGKDEWENKNRDSDIHFDFKKIKHSVNT